MKFFHIKDFLQIAEYCDLGFGDATYTFSRVYIACDSQMCWGSAIQVHRILVDIVSAAASATPGLGKYPPLKREVQNSWF